MDLSQCHWSPEVLAIEKLLGGEYGRLFSNCYQVQRNDTQEKGILKLVWKPKMRQTSNGWKQVMNERLIWQKLSTEQYILPLLGFFETQACYGFVSVYTPSCCSLSFMAKSAPLPKEVIGLISAQIVLIMELCHKNGILLRNLSSDSFLIERSGRISLGDFEYAKFTKYSKKRCPAVEFASPEAIQNIEYGREADWFALGIIIFHLYTGKTPLSIYCERRELDIKNVTTESLLRCKLLSFFHSCIFMYSPLSS